MNLLPVAHAEDTLKWKRYKDIAEMKLNGTYSSSHSKTGLPDTY